MRSGTGVDISWADALDPSGESVASYVLDSHDAAVRVLNPAYGSNRRRLSWEELSGPSFQLRSDFQWSDVDHAGGVSVADEPLAGSIDDSVAAVLARILVPRNRRFIVAQWEGYADIDSDSAARLLLPPDRECIVRAVHAEQVLTEARKPMRWWDPDLAWTVGNDIYARSVFVSGSTAIIQELLRAPELEAFLVRFTDPTGPEDR